jgi:protein NrfD
MHELTSTRHNELIDPVVSVWDWQIPVYLFLGGMVAGMMIIAGYFMFSGRNKNTDCSCYIVPVISFFLISFGMLALFLDLEHKLYVWRLYLTFKITSPMSWGAWILVLVYPALILSILQHLPEKIKNKIPKISSISNKLASSNFWNKFTGISNMLIGGLLGIYTGVLLSTLGARPLWNTSILWMLFLVSGLSSAAAFVHLIAKNKEERELLAKADNGFLILELFVFALFIIGLLTSSEVYMKAVNIILSGPFAAVFWVFVILLGIVIPLIIQLMAVNHKVKHTPVAPIMVILGGLILRFVIVYAGQFSHWVK